MYTRKSFLAIGAVAGLTPQLIAATPSAKPTREADDEIPRLVFDVTAFDASLAKAAPHRHLFSAVPLDDGAVFAAIRNTVEVYRDSLNVSYDQILPVAVLYHGVSIALGFNDAAWNELFLPAVAAEPSTIRAQFHSAHRGDGNPYLHATHAHDSSLDALVSDCGLRTYICNNAMRSFARSAAKTLRMKPSVVYASLAANLVTNAMVVPAGVWAIHALQERRFTLLETSV